LRAHALGIAADILSFELTAQLRAFGMIAVAALIAGDMNSVAEIWA
jgi:hypothetical protein